MKKILTLIFYFALVTKLNAQQTDKALGSIKYLVLHQRDTLSPEYSREYMGLVFASQSSAYFSLNRPYRDSVMKAMLEEQMTKNPGNLKIDMRSAPNITEGVYYSFYQEGKAVKERPYMQAKYIFDAPLPKIDWQLSEETKEIETYNCKKAIGSYGGRQYISWYCPDIAVNAGPWRLSGLPGLILEAHDSTQQIKFVFQSFSTKDFYGRETISVSPKAEKTTEETFEKLVKAMRENPEEFLKPILSNGATIKIDKVTPAARNLFNNPMELPEKKL